MGDLMCEKDEEERKKKRKRGREEICLEKSQMSNRTSRF
jgi:hypothetical protein